MKPLTWDQLADLYDACHSQKARTLPMNEVFAWAEQKEEFLVDEEGLLYLKEAP